jgi:hypothetical protein
VTISDEDLDRWDARAKEYMDAPCYSFGPDVVAALVAEVRRLRAENERLHRLLLTEDEAAGLGVAIAAAWNEGISEEEEARLRAIVDRLRRPT